MLLRTILFGTLIILTFSCKKTNTQRIEENLPAGQVSYTGSFVSNDHPTSGKVKVITANGKKYLAVENFKTDAGPDLRVWLSPDLRGNDSVSLGGLKSTNGSFNYEIPAATNLSTHNKVLIWCIDFKVLFGHAVLQ